MNVKILSAAALGAVISISSLSSAHAAVLHKEDTAKVQTQQQASITLSKAKTVALHNCKGAVQSAQMKKADGVYVYVIKVLGEDGKVHTFNVNCSSGKVVKHHVENKQAAITKAKAQSIALNKCKGTVTSSALKKENGIYVYIIKISASNHTEQTIKVNAENGSICS
ncbi:PepSY domain-containing protein [Bacillus inaquosorum]|uniref:PepSY domain-containing protein n=1 Tax=Bacillus inaquosorum TaxID=483913 RepID=UPI00228027EE|nr:PepSY domain-containing protein [Bacillus inaquosorum]MCY7899522.1 PepSY domain-containing protein [Bacillus inaquosorum]MCY8262357.1 PepSY domain-containing protein [Bacillus inaquosorum]MCY8283182.1 PepSY domain-containing protein [Bacillus inaquosorum]MCY9015403.1 PepSY domain-containing protein [Bacillus inaquosorum]MCY9042590.1 PepSY domain-containing protein [Bacillus inaquosorum]